MKKITSIAVRGVRGVRRELTLQLNGSSLILRGDNGTGKSSIVAGLMWALTGEMEPSSRARTGTEEAYRSNILEKASASRVVVTLADGSAISVTPGNTQADGQARLFRDSCQGCSPFLVRRQLLNILEARPVDRFKYLETFLELEEGDRTREAFLARARDHEKAADVSTQVAITRLESIRSRLPRERRSGPLTWQALVESLTAWATELKMPPATATWEALMQLSARLEPLMRGEALARTRSSLTSALNAWVRVGEAPPNPEPLLGALEGLAESLSDAAQVELLQEAQRHLARHSGTEVCPLCGAGAPTLAKRVEQRLAALEAVQQTRQGIAEAVTAWRQMLQRLTEAQTAVATANEALGGALPTAQQPAIEVPSFENAGSDEDAARAIVMIAPDTFGSAVAKSAAFWQGALEAALAALPQEENSDGLRQFLGAIKATEEAELAIGLAMETAGHERRLAGLFSDLSDAVRVARQDVAQELLTQISGLVSEFYTAIHPPDSSDEETGAPKIEVQRRAAGTAHLRGSFHATEVDDPRWVYSDGHLDTVGICVFLALRRFRADRDGERDCRLIVLDDVVLSVDLAHGRRLLDVLRANFDDHQILILTHNGLFCDWCAQKLPSFKRMAISNWSLESGPQLGEYLSALEHIAEQIERATSPKLLAQAVMNLMDEWLAQARFAYALSVPAKLGEEYTLTDLWQPFASQMKSVAKAFGPACAQLATLLNDLSDLPKFRNALAAHDNEFAREYPLAAVREIAKNASSLVALLYCSKCTKFATAVPSIREPEVLRCGPKCEQIRYVRPSKAGAASAGGSAGP